MRRLAYGNIETPLLVYLALLQITVLQFSAKKSIENRFEIFIKILGTTEYVSKSGILFLHAFQIKKCIDRICRVLLIPIVHKFYILKLFWVTSNGCSNKKQCLKCRQAYQKYTKSNLYDKSYTIQEKLKTNLVVPIFEYWNIIDIRARSRAQVNEPRSIYWIFFFGINSFRAFIKLYLSSLYWNSNLGTLVGIFFIIDVTPLSILIKSLFWPCGLIFRFEKPSSNWHISDCRNNWTLKL